MSVTTGGLGAFGANHHLRQSLTALNVPVLQQPEAYISRAAELFDDEGRLKNESTQKLVEKFLHAYAGWVAGILNQGK
jgi:chromate reductase